MYSHLTSRTKPYEEQSPEWEYYSCCIDSKPAIISADLSLANYAPYPRLQHLFYLTVHVQQKDVYGFPSPTDLSNFCRMEDALLEAFREVPHRLVGRISTDGCRDFMFYTNKPLALKRLGTAVMNRQPEYTFTMGRKLDRDWNFYYTFLFPNEKELNALVNQRQLDMLEFKGELDLKVPLKTLEHRFFFKTEQQRDEFILFAIDHYFTVTEIGLDGDNPANPWLLRISRPEGMELENINKLTLALLQKAKRCNGLYDGWDTRK